MLKNKTPTSLITLKNQFTNHDLKSQYDNIYRTGAYDNFFSLFNPYWVHRAILDSIQDWRGKKVLEIGCGQGELSAQISFAGAHSINAIDYSKAAIEIATTNINLPNVKFDCVDGNIVQGSYDVVVMAGVLEHTDHPYAFLDKIFDKNLNGGGQLITVMPSFLNPRGYVWMTLQILLGVPMSLTDIHFFLPDDIKNYAEEKGLKISISTIDQDWGCGERLINDFNKRLRNALRDAKLDASKVDLFIEWLDTARKHFVQNEMSGALMLCRLDAN